MSELVTPTDYELRAAMKALIVAADGAARVLEEWNPGIVTGESLNAAVNPAGVVHAAMLSLKDEKRVRVGDVPYEPDKALATKYALKMERVYRFFFVRRYDDAPEAGKSTERRFNEWLDQIVERFSKSPKLGQNARVESHGELYVYDRRIPPFGGERAHAADGLLSVHLHQTVTPT